MLYLLEIKKGQGFNLFYKSLKRFRLDDAKDILEKFYDDGDDVF